MFGEAKYKEIIEKEEGNKPKTNPLQTDELPVFVTSKQPNQEMIDWNMKFLPPHAKIHHFNDEEQDASALNISLVLENEGEVNGVYTAYKT